MPTIESLKIHTGLIRFAEYLQIQRESETRKTLELLSSASDSISQFLDGKHKLVQGYDPYLLSKKVRYHELEELWIDGACGTIEDSEISIPKSLENDDHFLYNAPKVPYTRHSYSYPHIEEFEVIVSQGFDNSLYELALLPQSQYLSLYGDPHEEQFKIQLGRFQNLFKTLKIHGVSPYHMEQHDLGFQKLFVIRNRRI